MNTDTPRILFVDHSGLPGGGQLGLARFLRRTSLSDVYVLLLGGGAAFDGVVKERGFVLDVASGPRGEPSLVDARSYLRRRIAELRPQIVIANSNRSALILASIPRVGSERRLYYMRDDLNPQRKSLVKRLLIGHWMMRRYDRVIANSRWTASTIPIASIRSRTKVAYPVCGIDDIPTTNDKHHGERVRILSLSRIARWKGLHILLEAMRILESRGRQGQVSLTVAGGSSHEDPQYERVIRESSVSALLPVDFVGHVDDIHDLRVNSDILVACSISPEPFGQVVVQGMASGLVTIASAQGGPTEIIRNGVDGYLVPPGDATVLADLIETLLDDESLRKKIGDEAIRSASKFTDTAAVDVLDAVIRSEVAVR